MCSSDLAAERVLLERAARLVSQADARSVPLAVLPYAAVAFGSASTPHQSRLMFRAWQLTGESDYLRVGTNTAAHTLGLNATGTSWVTGLGPNAVRAPLHTPSLADGIEDAVPGIVVYGPANYDASSGILGAALAAFDPPVDDWPLHERFADVAYVPQYNEFTVAESLAPTLYAFGFLAALDGDSDGDTATDTDSAPPDTAVDGETGGDDPPPPTANEADCGCSGGGGTAGSGLAAALAAWATRARRSRTR